MTVRRRSARLISRRSVLRLAAAGLAAFALPVRAQSPARADHLRLAQTLPVATPPPAVEVLDLFWYGCPHCHRLEPHLEAWLARRPPNVTFRRLPAVLTDSWRPAARLFYALEALGRIPALHRAVFDAEHVAQTLQVQSRDLDPFAAFAEAHGIPRTAFVEAWQSAAVAERVDAAARLTQPLRRIGVPALIVDGRFLSTVSLAGSPESLFATVDRLVDEVRAERSAAAGVRS